MANEELTERQQKVLKFIKTSLLATGYPPTLREIGQHLGIRSTNGVSDHLKALMKKGYLAKETGKSRTLSLLEPKSKTSIAFASIPIFASLNELSRSVDTSQVFAVLDKERSLMTIYQREKKDYSAISSFHFAL